MLHIADPDKPHPADSAGITPPDRRAPWKFLVIRRDNIGDLVCTTPMLAALRTHFPTAYIAVLVNTYNGPVLEGHPHVDAVYAYTKAKHRSRGSSVLRVHWRNAALLPRLRNERFDYAILAGSGFLLHALRFARWLRPRHILGYVDPSRGRPRGIDIPVRSHSLQAGHEVENVFRLLAPIGIDEMPPAAHIIPTPEARERALAALQGGGAGPEALRIAVHIGARKPSNRWSEDCFVELIRNIHRQFNAVFMLLWAPGASDDPRHPGDDAKARRIIESLRGLPVVPYATEHLAQLIGAVSACDLLVCGDGGASHLAAGLARPVLCFFGDSSATRWHPWGVPYVLLQPNSHNVADITVGEALAGFQRLQEKTQYFREGERRESVP